MPNALSQLYQSLKTTLGMGQNALLLIEIPIGRSGAHKGRLSIKDCKGRQLPGNIPLRTYGTTPIGHYNVMGIRVSGSGTPYPAEFYGPEGIVMLEAIPSKNYLTLQGGRSAPQNDLLATKGGFRVNDRDMRSIIIALETIEGPIACRCVALNYDDDSQLSQQEDYQQETLYERSKYTEENSEDLEFQPEAPMNRPDEVPIEQWLETAMNDDGYV